MGEVSVRSVACYPWALSAGPWAFRRVVRVKVHVGNDAIRIEPRGRHARLAPALVLPLRLVTGVDDDLWRLWLRTDDRRDDPVGLATVRWRLAPALRAADVPETPTSTGRDGGWRRPGTVPLTLLVIAALVVGAAIDPPASNWLGLATWIAFAAWYFALAPRGPYGGQRLLWTDGGWVEEPQTQPTPA
jgi:hypothetical protein